MKTIKIKVNIFTLLFMLVIFTTNISQLPIFFTFIIIKYLVYLLWILLFFFSLFNNKLYIPKNYKTLILFFVVIISSLIFEVLTNNKYIRSSMMVSLFISMFVFFIGKINSYSLSIRDFDKILNTYVISTLIVCLYIFIIFFADDLGLNSRIYAYDSKNSIGQIAYSALIILIFNNSKINYNRIFRKLSILFLFFFIIILRSRATILGLVISALIFLLSKSRSKKNKSKVIISIILLSVILIINQNARDIIIKNILLAGRNVNDLDDISSGRISIITTFPSLIKDNRITGIGDIYFECFPLSVILNLGIISGSFLLYISYAPFFYSLRNKDKSIYNEMFFYIAIGFVVNSIFEGLTPLGPGVKCYILWMLYGLLEEKCLNSK